MQKLWCFQFLAILHDCLCRLQLFNSDRDFCGRILYIVCWFWWLCCLALIIQKCRTPVDVAANFMFNCNAFTFSPRWQTLPLRPRFAVIVKSNRMRCLSISGASILLFPIRPVKALRGLYVGSFRKALKIMQIIKHLIRLLIFTKWKSEWPYARTLENTMNSGIFNGRWKSALMR